MAANIVTTEDLQILKGELIAEIETLLSKRHSQYVKKWLKSSELRKILPLSAGTLHNLRVSGTLPYTRIGGVIFYSQDDIQKLIDENKSVSQFPLRKGTLQ